MQQLSERPLSDPSPDVATTCTYGMPLVSEVLFGTLSGGAASRQPTETADSTQITRAGIP